MNFKDIPLYTFFECLGIRYLKTKEDSAVIVGGIIPEEMFMHESNAKGARFGSEPVKQLLLVDAPERKHQTQAPNVFP